MNRAELAEAIYRTSHITGSFRLRSGIESGEYFDKYLFESSPQLLSEIADHLSTLIPDGTEMLAGLELGGIPIAAALSLKSGLPSVFVRKKAKDYGTMKFAECPDVNGRRLCLVEDVTTTGGQILKSARELRAIGALVGDAICVVVRNESASASLHEEGIALGSLYRSADLPGQSGEANSGQ